MNNYKCLTNINTSKTLLSLLFYVTNQPIRIRKLNEGVSGELINSRAHMSLDNEKLSRRGFLEAAGKALSVIGVGTTLASSPIASAFAADAKTANWNDPELEELRKASDATREYAENNDGVGILIHVGTKDIPSTRIKSPEQLGQIFVNRFAKLGVDAQFFIRHNDQPATGITYHIGHQIHGAESGNEVKLLREAWNVAPDVVEQLRIVKQLASLETDAPRPVN